MKYNNNPNETSIDVIDNFKKIQSYISTNNNNAVQKPVFNGGAFSRDNIINFEPSTSKLKKILMNSKDENQPAKEAKGKQKLFLCSDCKEYFSRSHLFQHIKSVHNKFTCLYCYGFFVSVESLEKHLCKKHKIQNSAFLTGDQLSKYLEDSDLSSDKKSIQAVCCKCGDLLNENFLEHNCGLTILKQLDSVRNTTSTPLNMLPDVEMMDLNPPLSLQSIANNIQVHPSQPPAAANSILSSILSIPSSLSISSVPQQFSIPTLPQISAISPIKPLKEVDNEKLLVPKLKLSIPKNFQPTVESEEESEESESEDERNADKPLSTSGDETDDEEEDDDMLEEQAKILEEMHKVQSQIENTMSKKLPKLQIKLSSGNPPVLKQEEQICSPPTPVHTPSIKIKIKNITSQILEPVIEQICEAGEPLDLVELAADNKSLMDLDESLNDVKMENSLDENNPQSGNSILIDNVNVLPAGDDVIPIDIGQLEESLDKFPIRKFLKICLKSAIPTCLYCNHARKIVVNGKSLAIHFITNHRFQATVNSITEEELKPEKILTKFESNLEALENCYFNLDTFDNQDEDKKQGNITISHDKLFECFQCRFQTHIHKELYLHNRKMHQKSLVVCLMCKVHFHSYSELVCHICPGIPNKQMPDDFMFYCCMCNMDHIPSGFRLMVHLRKKHFACDICLEKCNDQSKLSNHVWKHKLHHICYRCGLSYRNKADIQKHLFWKHGTEGVTCKRCLLKKWKHVYHFCIPPSMFSCELCLQNFNLANALKVHRRLHDNFDKYPCSEDNCEKKFISRKLLRKHIDRHFAHLTALEASGEEKKSNGTIIVPAFIPDGHSARTTPCIFRDLTKRKQDSLDLGQALSLETKPDVLKDIAKSERKKKKEELKAKKAAETKAADFSDLPEMKLNLSESDSSDDEDMNPKTENNTVLAHNETSHMKNDSNDAISKMSDSEDEPESSENKEHSQSIWDNFKMAQQLVPNVEVPDVPEIPAKMCLHVVQSDHDYSRMFRRPGDEEEIKEVVPVLTPSKKSSPKKKRKIAKPPGQSSSSSSSSDSDSSSCCSKSNCSCSSSSSGSSSSSSDEEKSKKGKNEFSSKSNDAIDVVATDDVVPKGPDDIIYESDLVTDESDTDEDFYDEHPQKMANDVFAEKRRHLLLQSYGEYDGIVENSRPSTPSLPPDEISEKIEKKRMKIKKKKRERKSSKSGGSLASPVKRTHSPALHQSYNAYQDSQQYYNNSSAIYEQGGFHQSYPNVPKVPKMEMHQVAEIRHLLQSNHQQPVLPIMQMQMDRERYTPNNSATSSRKNSECGDATRASQRRRVPNRFYGYTSEDDSFSAQAQLTNNPFKPVPPPNLVWSKEDLPSGSKMKMVTPTSAKRSDPFSYDEVNEYAYEQNEPPKSAPARVLASQQYINFNDSDSSENALQINHEPRKRQRRDVTPKPPIPKLKLSIGLDNKIKKRRIQSSSTVSAQKRRQKVEPIHTKRNNTNNEVLSFTTTSLPDSLLYDSNSSGIGAGIGLTSLLPPSQLLKSPHFDSTPSYHESYNLQQQKLTQRQLEQQGQQSQKQRLEDAIQKTQQYYKQFNHQQIRPQNQQEVKEGERLYCYCRSAYDEASEMIGCDGDNCQIEWFHFECVGILVAPKGKWYCPECQKQHMH